MNSDDLITPLSEDFSSEAEREKYHLLLKSAYPAPETDLKKSVMAAVALEMKSAKRKALIRSFTKWGSVAACALIVTAVSVALIPQMKKSLADTSEIMCDAAPAEKSNKTECAEEDAVYNEKATDRVSTYSASITTGSDVLDTVSETVPGYGHSADESGMLTETAARDNSSDKSGYIVKQDTGASAETSAETEIPTSAMTGIAAERETEAAMDTVAVSRPENANEADREEAVSGAYIPGSPETEEEIYAEDAAEAATETKGAHLPSASPYHTIPQAFIDLVGEGEYSQWYSEASREPCGANIVSFLTHFSVSRDEFEKICTENSIDGEAYPADILYSGDAEKIENHYKD